MLVIAERNHGVEIDRLTTDDLSRVWKRPPVFLGREMSDVAFIDDRFCTIVDGLLVAYGWQNGDRLWESPLPNTGEVRWKIVPSPAGLLVYPDEAILLKPHFDAIGEFRRAGWDRDALLRAVDRSYDVWTEREFPVLLIDSADGRLTQRFTVPAVGPAGAIAVTEEVVMVVTGRGRWTLKSP